jgi:hypothetical protein
MPCGRGFQRVQRKKVLMISTFKNRPILPLSDPDWIQTNDPKLRRFVLYSAELPGRYFRSKGILAAIKVSIWQNTPKRLQK